MITSVDILTSILSIISIFFSYAAIKISITAWISSEINSKKSLAIDISITKAGQCNYGVNPELSKTQSTIVIVTAVITFRDILPTMGINERDPFFQELINAFYLQLDTSIRKKFANVGQFCNENNNYTIAPPDERSGFNTDNNETLRQQVVDAYRFIKKASDIYDK